MTKFFTKLVLDKLEQAQIVCDYCEKYGHSNDKILVIIGDDQIRNAKYCIYCGKIFN